MIRTLSFACALLLAGCGSVPVQVELRDRANYPGARIAIAQIPSSGDVAISLGSIEHVLVSTQSPHPTPADLPPRATQPSHDTTSRTKPIATAPVSGVRLDGPHRQECDSNIFSADAGIDSIDAVPLGRSSVWTVGEACPVIE